MYYYRCTEQQLEDHLTKIAESGDEVLHVIFKGGRDYVLICRRAGAAASVLVLTPDELAGGITRAVDAALVAAEKRAEKRVRTHRLGAAQ